MRSSLSSQAIRAKLMVEGTEFLVPSLLVRDDMPDPPGMIGMDLLGGSVLMINPDPGEPIHWLVSSH